MDSIWIELNQVKGSICWIAEAKQLHTVNPRFIIENNVCTLGGTPAEALEGLVAFFKETEDKWDL